MKHETDLARSRDFRARLDAIRGPGTLGTLGADDDDEEEKPKACKCAPAFGWKTGAALGAAIAAVVAFNVGTEVGAAAQRRSSR